MHSLPILYSFRRCPYAMRARLALLLQGIQVEIREVVLKDKPESLLSYSAKATVPVLITQPNESDERVIDESLDIINWAMQQKKDSNLTVINKPNTLSLIKENDTEFKYFLDRYKYADRYPESSEREYRQNAESFITKLEAKLAEHPFLCGDQISLADIAIWPFVRQFAHVDLDWFSACQHDEVRRWLNTFKAWDVFLACMKKYPAWKEGDNITVFKSP